MLGTRVSCAETPERIEIAFEGQTRVTVIRLGAVVHISDSLTYAVANVHCVLLAVVKIKVK